MHEAILEEVCRQLIAQCPHIQFGVARWPADLEAVYRLRYREVIGRGWAEPSDYPDGLENDIYDERAVQIVGWDGDTVVATTRVVLPSPNHLLPTEAAFDMQFEPRGSVVDVGRTVVASDYRDSLQHKVLFGLLGQMALEVQARGFSEVCGTMSDPVIALYRKIGVDVAVRGPMRPYWNEVRYPCSYDLLKSAITIQQRMAAMASRG